GAGVVALGPGAGRRVPELLLPRALRSLRDELPGPGPALSGGRGGDPGNCPGSGFPRLRVDAVASVRLRLRRPGAPGGSPGCAVPRSPPRVVGRAHLSRIPSRR